ncbi:hypothetical protein ABB34_09230 [Stenotrophomonas daejeonensis]|uniref:AlgX/AlgJ SGNH hydrolase-like domain-containing protein n=2 Tax=Stenotrophomonas daejeonensis TaxID=659018 RepID=A0A0R0DR27_9GAMM|nr:hypothetical protein ABB34_09230 [Stenotrophomonas daejeonensis]
MFRSSTLSRPYGWGVMGILLALAASIPAHAQSALVGKEGWVFYAGDEILHSDMQAVHRNVALMRDAGEQLQAAGVGLVVVVVPLKARLAQQKLPEGVVLGDAVQERYAAIMREFAAAGVVATDAMRALAAVQAQGMPAFFRTDSHWTAWSAEATGVATAELIKRHWSLSGQPGTGKRLGPWVKERRFSDLADLMGAAQRKAIGPEVFTIRNPDAEGGLLDDDVAVVHVVGNSSAQPYLGFSQALSNGIDRPVGLSWKYGNFGPWAVLLEYLESPEFREHRPQVLVWQLDESQMLYGPDAPGQWDNASTMSEQQWRQRLRGALGQ